MVPEAAVVLEAAMDPEGAMDPGVLILVVAQVAEDEVLQPQVSRFRCCPECPSYPRGSMQLSNA